jgi:glycosyltransferase involved in cell wall biosynthesis
VISIITRCRNRLEYTAQVLDAVKRRTKEDYEHIIIDNASTDGTPEWFRWMAENSWYDKIRYFCMDRNTGDWGGMLAGFAQAKGEYIVQLDNDIIPAEGWLKAMREVLESSPYKIVMLKRANVAWKLKYLSAPLKVGEWQVVKVERAVACYMMHRVDFQKLARKIPESKGLQSKYMMAKLVNPIGKIINRTCIEIEAEDQRIKYNPQNPQIWEKV